MSNVNTLPVSPYARRPRGAVKLNGTIVEGWVSWEVENNAYRAADTFRLVFATSDLPPQFDANWFSNQTQINVEIFATDDCLTDDYSPSADDSLILGATDEIDYNPYQREITLTGRDYTAKFIDTKTTDHYLGKTSSAIASLLAQKHGLTTTFISKTSTQVGSYYHNEHSITNGAQSEWDMLTYLAHQEGFDVFVDGNDLHFEPESQFTDNYLIQWEEPDSNLAYSRSNVITLDFTRNLTIAGGVTVQVRSWNQASGKTFVANYPTPAKGIKPGQSESKVLQYKYNIPGLSQQEALGRAQKIYANIVQHQMKMSCYMPGNSDLDCSMTVTVVGTSTAFDQVYYPEHVVRTMSIDEGYRINLRAKNTTPESEEAY